MKYNSILRILMVVASIMIVCVVLGSRAPAVAKSGQVGPFSASCSDRTLFGDYGTQIEGTLLGPNIPIRGLLLAHYDGAGNLQELAHIVVNGVAPVQEWTPGTGTYTVNSNCTGSAMINSEPPIPLHFVVVNQGKEIHQVVDGDAFTVIAHKVE